MSIARPRTALLKTSAATDVKSSGGIVDITGLDPISKKAIVKVLQFKYRAEVSKVETIGASYTPLAATQYIITITDPTSARESHSNAVVPRRYIYQTPATITDLGATAALQREAINSALVTKINADSGNNVTAASLLTGTGLTITDNAGYYPAKTAGGISPRMGATSIYCPKDSNARGFADATDRAITTAAVYQFGEGTRLASDVPVVYALGGGNIVAGIIDCPMTTDNPPAGPVAGQQYDAFAITHLVRSEVPTIGEVLGNRLATSMIFVDNGKGTATTNAAGFATFEREMHKLLFSAVYGNDSGSVIEFFDRDFVIQGPLGAVPVTTTATNNSLAVYNKFITPYGMLQHRNIGTQTIVAPTEGASGLLIDQDINTGDGAHYSPDLATNNNQQFVVGKQAFSVIAKFVATDITKGIFQVGFHEKNVFFLDWNDYVNLGTIGLDTAAGAFTTRGILANAATVSTVSAGVAVNSVISEYRVNVAIDGTVTCYANNVKYPIYSVGTTPLVFAAGTVLVPFFQMTNITGTAAVGTISEFVAVADDSWKVDA